MLWVTYRWVGSIIAGSEKGLLGYTSNMLMQQRVDETKCRLHSHCSVKNTKITCVHTSSLKNLGLAAREYCLECIESGQIHISVTTHTQIHPQWRDKLRPPSGLSRTCLETVLTDSFSFKTFFFEKVPTDIAHPSSAQPQHSNPPAFTPSCSLG